MIQPTRTFRVFVSSTFSDLKAERNALQEKVFPELKKLCVRHGCRFQAIDLRWGVSEEAGLDHQTMRICLEEILLCQQLSPRPNFIVLLGDRYGWQPAPYEIPADEHELIVRMIAADERSLLNEWYKRDDNFVPAIYHLKQRTGQFIVPEIWKQEEIKILNILRKAVKKLKLSEESRDKYFSSAVEQEIIKGVLKIFDADQHVFGFFRNFKVMPHGRQCEFFIDLDDDGKPDCVAHERLSRLKESLRSKLPGNIFDYEVGWTGHRATHDHIVSLCKDVYNALEKIIKKEIIAHEKSDLLDQEVFDQEIFRNARSKHFVGRKEINKRILEYVGSVAKSLLCISGVGGSGKSALMSRIILDIKTAFPAAAVVFRFIGASAHSSNIRSLLDGLCRQITRIYDQDEETIPREHALLVEDFQQRLSFATYEKPLILVIDALDQLWDVDGVKNLGWLPNQLPQHVHIIVSVLAANAYLPELQKKLPSSHIWELTALKKREVEDLFDIWFGEARKQLTANQRRALYSASKAYALPLYLKLAFEEACRWRADDEVSILSSEIHGVIGELFNRLSAEKNHGHVVVSHSLGYLAAAKNGLTEDELIDILSMDGDVLRAFKRRSRKSPPIKKRLPVIIWSRLYFDLKPYLTERNADQANLISFFHRIFHSQVVERFLTNGVIQKRHQQLAKYFGRQPLIYDQQGTRFVNIRKLSEQLFQQIEGEAWRDVAKTLCDFHFIKEKCNAGMTYELFDELAAAYYLLKREKIGSEKRILKSAIRLIADGTEHHTDTNLHFAHAYYSYRSEDRYKIFYRDLLTAGQKRRTIQNATSSTAQLDRLHLEFIAKDANIRRREGHNLESAERKINKYLKAWHRLNQIYGDLDVKDLARGEYDFAYICYLRGEFKRAVEMFAKSASHSKEAEDQVGEWISRCVEYSVRYLGEINPIDDFETVLKNAMATFREYSWGNSKNPHAIRWVMNVNAHLFEVAFEKDDADSAENQIALLDSDFWIAHFAEPHFMTPYYARYAFLKNDYEKAAALFESYIKALKIEDVSKSLMESLSREYLVWGRSLLLSGEKKKAIKIWKEGLRTRDDLANHAWKKRIMACLNNLDDR